MLQRVFGKTSIPTSVIGLGTWNIGNQWGPIDETTSYSTIRTAFDCGMTLFDTAESYGIPNGLSEERLGRALAGIRHQVTVVSKTGNWGKRTGGPIERTSPDQIRLCVHASLHRLRTDWVDVVLARINHAGHSMDASPEKVVPLIDQMAASGKGIYGMKVVGAGSELARDPSRAVRFVLGIPSVHALVMGMMSEAEILENTGLVDQLALA